MPNHVTTVCTVTGRAADVARFAKNHIVTRKARKGRRVTLFDFESIIPMPQCVKDTMRPCFDDPIPRGVPKESVGDGDVELCAQAFLTDARSLPVYPRPGWLPASIRTWDDLCEHYETTKPAVVFWARRTLRCAAETLTPGWYEWSKQNWGTKWGSYDFGIRERAADGKRLVFAFDTAWSFPMPIFVALKARYPRLVFDCATYDEGSNFAGSGQFNGANDFAIGAATPATYARVYGHPPDPPEQDEEEAAEVEIATVPTDGVPKLRVLSDEEVSQILRGS